MQSWKPRANWREILSSSVMAGPCCGCWDVSQGLHVPHFVFSFTKLQKTSLSMTWRGCSRHIRAFTCICSAKRCNSIIYWPQVCLAKEPGYVRAPYWVVLCLFVVLPSWGAAGMSHKWHLFPRGLGNVHFSKPWGTHGVGLQGWSLLSWPKLLMYTDGCCSSRSRGFPPA